MKTTKKYIIEGTKINKDATYLLESFSSGSASKVVQKLSHVINNKLGTNFIFAEIPMEYSNSYGTFAGYLGNDDSSGIMLKINFLLSGSDSITSFDVYLNGYEDTPTYTVDTDGQNIIQIVDSITENFIDDGLVDDDALEEECNVIVRNVLNERGNITNEDEVQRIIDIMVSENKGVLKDLQKLSVPDIYNGVWSDWTSDKPNYQGIKYYLFAKALKMYLLKKGLVNKTLKPRKKGSTERPVEDPILEAQLQDIVETLSWQDKFDFLKGSIKQLCDGNIQSIYLYGNPGSGKSFTVIEELDKLNVLYNVYKGSVIHGEDDLLRIIYNHADDNSVLVFDDADAVLKKTDPNIWKSLLDNGVDERIITSVDVNRTKNKNIADIPVKFSFNSAVIFISNVPKLNGAIASRSLVMDISLSNDEMINKMETTLKEFRPNIPLEIKKKALDYAKEISGGVKSIDYRTLDSIIISMQISPTNWKKQVVWMLQSM